MDGWCDEGIEGNSPKNGQRGTFLMVETELQVFVGHFDLLLLTVLLSWLGQTHLPGLKGLENINRENRGDSGQVSLFRLKRFIQ